MRRRYTLRSWKCLPASYMMSNSSYLELVELHVPAQPCNFWVEKGRKKKEKGRWRNSGLFFRAEKIFKKMGGRGGGWEYNLKLILWIWFHLAEINNKSPGNPHYQHESKTQILRCWMSATQQTVNGSTVLCRRARASTLRPRRNCFQTRRSAVWQYCEILIWRCLEGCSQVLT